MRPIRPRYSAVASPARLVSQRARCCGVRRTHHIASHHSRIARVQPCRKRDASRLAARPASNSRRCAGNNSGGGGVGNKTPTGQPSQLAAKTKAESAARSAPIDASPLSLSAAHHIASEALPKNEKGKIEKSIKQLTFVLRATTPPTFQRAFHRAQHPCKVLHAAGAVRDWVQREGGGCVRSSLRGGGRVQPRHVLEHLPDLAVEREVEGKNRNKAGEGEERNNSKQRKKDADQTKGAQVSISCFILLGASGMKCRAKGSGMHVMKHAMLALVQWRQHLFTPLQPPITSAILHIFAQPYMYLLHTLYWARAATRETASGLLPIWEIHVAHATPVLDEANSSWTIGKDVDEAKTRWKKINEAHPTPITIGNNKVNSNNTSWHIGSRTAPTPVARAVSPNLVDSDNTSLKIGCSVPNSGRLRSVYRLVDSNNTPWKIGGSVPTPVAARAVSPDLVDGDNTSWKILCNPVVQARAENVDSDNKSWEIHNTREEVDAANTSWIIGSNEACAVPISDLVDGGSLTEVLLWPLYTADYRGGA
ncbi:hypothetical protein B0H14DRAFT_2647033 [Mycena olivaceomarginata]|nr:hypothetical protein B0H14DRAFT_2647033 [Mycena olivaceomarginata]